VNLERAYVHPLGVLLRIAGGGGTWNISRSKDRRKKEGESAKKRKLKQRHQNVEKLEMISQ